MVTQLLIICATQALDYTIRPEYTNSNNYLMNSCLKLIGLNKISTERCLHIVSTWSNLVFVYSPLLTWFAASVKVSTFRYLFSLVDSISHSLEYERVSETDQHSTTDTISLDGWCSDGPDKMQGATFDHVNIVGRGRILLRDISVSVPAGKITVMFGQGAAVEDIRHLLSVIWGSDKDSEISVQRGRVSVTKLCQHFQLLS